MRLLNHRKYLGTLHVKFVIYLEGENGLGCLVSFLLTQFWQSLASKYKRPSVWSTASNQESQPKLVAFLHLCYPTNREPVWRRFALFRIPPLVCTLYIRMYLLWCNHKMTCLASPWFYVHSQKNLSSPFFTKKGSRWTKQESSHAGFRPILQLSPVVTPTIFRHFLRFAFELIAKCQHVAKIIVEILFALWTNARNAIRLTFNRRCSS